MRKLLNALCAPFRVIGKVLKDCATDEYGQDFDTVNASATLAFLVGIGLVIAGFVAGKDFNLDTYALGVGALLAATTGAQRFKPPAQPPSNPQGGTPQ